MRLTRRGRVTVAVVALGTAMAWGFGARALNAVVAPLVVALVVGPVQLWLAETPTVTRRPLVPGRPGDRRTVELTVEGTDGTSATVVDSLPEGLTVETDDSGGRVRTTRRFDAAGGSTGGVTLDVVVETTLPSTVAYDVRADGRGAYDVGPVVVRLQDVLGLVESRHPGSATAELVVYPPVRPLDGDALGFLRGRGTTGVAGGEFDGIREYRPGDSLRHVDWKASASSPGGLYVTTYRHDHGGDAVTVALATDTGGQPSGTTVDRVAAAAASVTTATLDAGYSVGLVTEEPLVAPGRGEDHATRVLDRLARLSPVDLATTHADADVVVRADGDRVVVESEGDRRPFESVVRAAADGGRQRAVAVSKRDANHEDGGHGSAGDGGRR